MTHSAPLTGSNVQIFVDVLSIEAASIVVKNRATGRVHRFGYDHILIGSDKDARCYEIRMPLWLAVASGIRTTVLP